MSSFEGGKKQRLSFNVRKPNGTQVEVGAVVPSSMDPTIASRAIAEYFMATLNGTPVPEVLPIVVEKPAAQSSEPVAESTVSDSVSSVSSAPQSSHTFDDTVASVGSDLEAVKRALVKIIEKTNNEIPERTAEWQDELAKRSAALWTAATMDELRAAFIAVMSFLKGET